MSAHSDENPVLTNEEIELLYDIVRDAQTLPGRPLRALFTAYDRVLAQQHRADHGSRCFTFLLRMHEERVDENEGLVDRFKRVLSQVGIEVELDPEGEGVEVTTNLNLDPSTQTQSRTRHPRSRRGSLDSYLESAPDRDYVAGKQDGLAFRPRRPSVAASDTEALAPLLKHAPIRGRENGHRRAASGGMRPRRPTSVSSHGSLRIRRDGNTGNQRHFADYDDDDSEPTDSFDRSHIRIPGVNAPLPGMGDGNEGQGNGYHAEIPYQPSQNQMERDAETFYYHHMLAQSRSYLQNWQEQAHHREQQHEEMETTALAFDRNVLLRASLDSWRIALTTKLQDRETERFFAKREERAAKARDLFLLTKAFTHWATSTQIEIQRTSTARRHILRTRYFNAWRDITAVNELKVRHFVLARFLEKWRTRTAALTERNNNAVALYEHNLVYRVYWDWFWRYCERGAPQLHLRRLAQGTIRSWVEKTAILKEQESLAIEYRQGTLLRKCFSRMQDKAAVLRAQSIRADHYRTSALLSDAFHDLYERSQLAPLERQISVRIDYRLVRGIFQTWHRDAQQQRRAREFDRQRILRKAATSWFDLVRIKYLTDDIDYRVQKQALVKWRLETGGIVLRRVYDRNKKASIFDAWRQKSQNREDSLESAQRRFESFKRRQTLRFCMRQIENVVVQRRINEELAVSTYQSKMKGIVWQTMMVKLAHFQQLSAWSTRAAQYVAEKNALSAWRRATEFSRRNRRREAYAQIRRTVKMNLVRRTLDIWRTKHLQIADAERRADDFANIRLRTSTTNVLVHWHERTIHLHSLATQSETFHTNRLLSISLLSWTNKMDYYQQLEQRATSLRSESIEMVANNCFKKLGWKVFMNTRMEENAVKLEDRFFSKHVRGMIRFWAAKMAERRRSRRAPGVTPRRRGDEGDDDDVEDDDGGGGGGREEDDDNTRFNDDADSGNENENDGNDYAIGDETARLEAWTPYTATDLLRNTNLDNTNIDLSFTVSPTRTHPPSRTTRRPRGTLGAGSSSFLASASRSRTLGPGPQTRSHPQRQRHPSRRPPSPIPDILEVDEDVSDFDTADPDKLWTSTPMPPAAIPGYMKTPSKRSIARAKRSDLPAVLASPEKSPVRKRGGGHGQRWAIGRYECAAESERDAWRGGAGYGVGGRDYEFCGEVEGGGVCFDDWAGRECEGGRGEGDRQESRVCVM